MKSKKGIFFTIDGLLASAIIITVILLSSSFYIARQKSVNVNYAAQDLVRVFSELKVGEVDNSYVESLVESGQVSNPNVTILEQIGEFWSSDQLNLSYNLTKNLTESLIPKKYGFSVLVDGEVIYSRNNSLSKSLVSSRKIISGIAKAKPTEGHTARILLNGIKSKKTSSYVYFGGYEGDGNITKTLVLPDDVAFFNSSYIEVDASSTFDLYINNIYSGNYSKGSGGGGTMLADKWNISSAYLSNFVSGQNSIGINFTGNGSAYISGGFLRVTYITSSYNDTQIAGYQKEYLPGIDGAINIYSSVYAPQNLQDMSAYLHFLSQYQLYLTLGNTTIYQNDGSPADQAIFINSSNISSFISYAAISGNTLPLRLGLRIANYTGQGTKSDAVLITDRSGSMSDSNSCDIFVTNCTGACDSNPSGGCHDQRDKVAIKSNKKFIDTVLNISGNKVGLVGFGTSLYPYCDFHEINSDNTSLKNRVTNYYESSCGATCISCGILESTKLLIEKEALYGMNQTIANNNSFYKFSSAVALNMTLDISVNQSKFVKSRLTVFARDVDVDDPLHDCVYLNGNYLGQMCDSAPEWHTCSFPLKREWFSSASKNNVTFTAGNNLGCFGTAGTNDNWEINYTELVVWQTANFSSNLSYYTSLPAGNITVGDPSTHIAQINISVSINQSALRAATLEFEATGVNTDYFDCVFVNGNYVGRIDEQRYNGTNTWQRALFDVPVAWIKNGNNSVNITAGNTAGCKKTSGANDPWAFRKLNLSLISSNEGLTYDRYKSMLIMSDGDANTIIGGSSGSDDAAADTETIQKACEAYSLYGITIYTVLFGSTGSIDPSTLNQSACCDDCSHFYIANDSSSLLDAYTKIATSITSIGFSTQSVNISGNFLKTKLYPDSYIDFNYTPPPDAEFNKIPISFETQRFANNISSGSLLVYPNTTVSEAKVTSYSANKWTDLAYVNSNLIFNLSNYGNDYQILGDPFAVNIPANLLDLASNTISVSTGTGPNVSTGGSFDNRGIYTLLLSSFADYSNVVAKSDGCAWSLSFNDGSSSTVKIPLTYSGSKVCTFSPPSYDSDDALDNAAFQLFSNLDVDKDGTLDVIIASNNVDVNPFTISKVPSLWGPIIVEVRVWE
ncbi:MAG TPA: hypothetical protein VI564_04630 [Candidatus Nanoarchaeia archaeon]|nr:hypothetical protein [Candidatus Nanoarchaeia archaeon]